MTRLSGKTAVVTGGASGIGQAFAQRLARDGANVVVADMKPSHETRQMVEDAGARFFSFACDVTNRDDVERFAAQVQSQVGQVDILVNNVGIFPTKDFDSLDFDDWKTIQAVNIDPLFLFSKAFVPQMKAKGFGRIVNMASTVNWLVVENFVHYTTTKAACIGFTRALASELGKYGITVNAIAPGLVRNATTEASPLAGAFDMMAEMQPIHRVQVPGDLVGALSFLVSDDAAFMTGQTLVVDGGLVRI